MHNKIVKTLFSFAFIMIVALAAGVAVNAWIFDIPHPVFGAFNSFLYLFGIYFVLMVATAAFIILALLFLKPRMAKYICAICSAIALIYSLAVMFPTRESGLSLFVIYATGLIAFSLFFGLRAESKLGANI